MTSVDFPESLSFTAPYRCEDWQRGYASLTDELDYWIDEIDGAIPPELHGTLFRNGPGLLDVNGQRIQHPFDGDGMVCAIALQNGRAHFRNRYVQTEGYLAEQQAGKILYRGVFGTDKPGGWLANVLDFNLKNIANTNVLYWGGKLLALWEAAEPHRLDPTSLETLGLDNLNGILAPGEAFAAHPWIDPTGHAGQPCLVNFAIKTGRSSTITLFELATDGTLLQRYSHRVPGFCFIHDFAITPNYAIFFQNPVTFNPFPYFAGFRSAGECIQFHPEKPTRILLIPRAGKAVNTPPMVLETQSGFVFHHVNAFEADGTIAIDSICYADLPAAAPDGDYRQTHFEAIAPGQLWRFQVDPTTGKVQSQPIAEQCCEFPSIHPAKVGQAHRYAYLVATHARSGNAPHQAILKVDMETGDRPQWSAAPWGYVGEPVFVPRAANPYQLSGAEDDGWVMTLVFDATRDRSDVVILDAQNLQVVAQLHLKHHVPYGLHGSFTPECFVA